MTNSVSLFREISVWRRISDKRLVRYRCLQLLPEERFVVKSSHFYNDPIRLNDEQIKLAEYYFLDGLFDDGLVEIAKTTYETLEEAIAKHDEEFGDHFG